MLFFDETPAFAWSCCPPRAETHGLERFVAHTNSELVENGAINCMHYCLTVLNLFLSLLNNCKTCTQTRKGSLKCLA